MTNSLKSHKSYDQKKNLYKVLTCANSRYFVALRKFIHHYNHEQLPFDDLIVYDIGLTNDEENELCILEEKYGFHIHKLDFSKYPEHVNLNIEKWSGLYNSYAFKAIIIHKILQTINVPLFFLDCSLGFGTNTFEKISENVAKNNFWITVSAHKGAINSVELNHPEMLKHFNIDKNDIITCASGIIGMNYSDPYCKKIIDEWYENSLIENVIIPRGSSRNNHRQDQSVLSCVLHNNNFDYSICGGVPFAPWKHRPVNYENKYRRFTCTNKKTSRCESLIFINTLEEAIEIYMNRKQISKEELLENFIIQLFL